MNQKELGWRNDAVGCFVGIGALCLEDVLDNGFSFVILKHLSELVFVALVVFSYLLTPAANDGLSSAPLALPCAQTDMTPREGVSGRIAVTCAALVAAGTSRRVA